jgi:hypothetical protein
MKIPVRLVCQAVGEDYVFVQLEESRNVFTSELVTNIRKAMATLILRTYYKLLKKRCSFKKIKKELTRLYVK